MDDEILNPNYPQNCYLGNSDLHKDFGEVIGSDSFCFESSLLPFTSKEIVKMRAICYEVKCDNIKKQIIVKIGELTLNCPTYGKTINDPSGFKGSIKCPNYYDICDADALCNDMFECLNKQSRTDPNSYYYNDEENFDINSSKDQIFTVKKLVISWISCSKITGSYVFNIEGDFSKNVNILDKVNINLLTSSGKNIKSICTPFSETKYSNAQLQCDIDICKFPLENIDIYLPTTAPQEKGYKFNNWKKIIGAQPGESNIIRNVKCLPDIKNTFLPSSVKITECLEAKIIFEIYGEWEDKDESNIPTLLSFSLVIGNDTDAIAYCDLVTTSPIYMECEYLSNGDNKIIIEEQNFNGYFASYKIKTYNDIINSEKCKIVTKTPSTTKNPESPNNSEINDFSNFLNIFSLKIFWIFIIILII